MRTGTLSEYATHIGSSNAYVTKLKSQGRLVLVDDGGKQRVNFEASDRLIRNTADLGRAANGRNSGGGSAPMARLGERDPASGAGASGGNFDVLFRKAQTQERVFTAKLRELEYQEQAGSLLRVNVMEERVGHRYATAREALLNIPARIAPRLASESDPAAIQNMLEAEIHAALTELAAVNLAAAPAAPQPTEPA